MLILTVRTDNPEAEIGLFDNQKQLADHKWPAHRQLAETIHLKIGKELRKLKLDWQDIDGLVVFSGPGSFTGLRIGLSVTNALAYSLGAPIIATSGSSWIENGIKKLETGENDHLAVPDYGAPVRTTLSKK